MRQTEAESRLFVLDQQPGWTGLLCGLRKPAFSFRMYNILKDVDHEKVESSFTVDMYFSGALLAGPGARGGEASIGPVGGRAADSGNE
jgi:hypothetical protein